MPLTERHAKEVQGAGEELGGACQEGGATEDRAPVGGGKRPGGSHHNFVYYESRKRELKIRLMNEGRCDERLNARVEESTCVTYTGLHDKTN
jgi:hypothetical protein